MDAFTIWLMEIRN